LAQAEEGKDRLFNLDQQACACSASKAVEEHELHNEHHRRHEGIHTIND